jgi:hypothetical protein
MPLPFDTSQDALTTAIAICNDAAASPVLSGSCSVTNGSAIVTRQSGAPFLGQMTGSGISIGGVTYQVLSIQSTAQLTLTTNYAGTTGTATWTITPALLTGNVLNPQTNPAVWPLVNNCYRQLEDELLRLGVETFTKTFDFEGLEPSQATLNRELLYINWTGYWNGATVDPDFVLPDDLLEPLECFESQTGTNGAWVPMRQAPDQPWSQFPGNRFLQWGFWDGNLYFPQCTVQNDMKVRYLASAPDIVDGTTTLVIPHCKTALAFWIAEDASAGRGGIQMAQWFQVKRKEATNWIATRTARRENYSKFVRRAFRGGSRGEGRGRGGWCAPIIGS